MTVRNRYLEQMVDSASPEGLLILLVEGAVNFIRRAEMSIENEKLDEAHNSFIKAQNIYLELTITIDLDAGEFAENLGLVYQFLYNLLIEANLEKDLDKTRNCLRLAEEICELWKETVALAASEDQSDIKDRAKLLIDGLQQVEVPKTGVYAPDGTSKIVQEKIESDGVPSRLNVQG